MALTDTSNTLLQGMCAALDCWSHRKQEQDDALYWLLRWTLADIGLDPTNTSAMVQTHIPSQIRSEVLSMAEKSSRYWDDIRYASLEPVTQLWGTIVNGLRVVAKSDRATSTQQRAFSFSRGSLIAFFRAARERMEIADELYHAFKAMPAPECQALAALLNVHVDARLDSETMCRLVRLLDHEGPMSPSEHEDLATLTNTNLVDATFRGLRSSG